MRDDMAAGRHAQPASTRVTRFSRGLAGALVLSAALVPAMPVSAADSTLAGTWEGPWFEGMSSGSVHLVIEPDGASGTLALSHHDKFGEAPAALQGVAIADSHAEFRARGADGKWLVARLPFDPAKGSLKGFASHAGYKLLLDLRRKPSSP